MNRPDDRTESVWHNFRGPALETMRAPARAHHPSRQLVDDLIRRWFKGKTCHWMDVGIMGMVDYERLRPKLRFRFVGADISESVVADARTYLRDPADRVIVWNVENPPPSDLLGTVDVVTLRHVLNHCSYYEKPLEHVADVLRPGGRVVIVLHLALMDGPDELRTHREWDTPGEVIGNRYGRERFMATLARLFDVELWARVDDGAKPNDILVARKPRVGSPAGRSPLRLELFMPAGRRHLVRRLLALLWLRWRTRLLM